VLLGVFRRWGQHSWTRDDLVLMAVMGAVSIAGAALGALGEREVALSAAEVVRLRVLIAVGLWMLYEAIAHVEHRLVEPSGVARWLLAAVVAFYHRRGQRRPWRGRRRKCGFRRCCISFPFRSGGGTLSLMVSVPTVAAGAVTDRFMGRITNAMLMVAVLMGAASAVGVLFGAALVPSVRPEVIKGLLGLILLVATVRLTVTPER